MSVDEQKPELLNEQRLEAIARALEEESAIAAELAQPLIVGLRAARGEIEASRENETNLLTEIDRLNRVTNDLIEYVETIADVVADGLHAADDPTEIKKKALDLILRSVQDLKTPPR